MILMEIFLMSDSTKTHIDLESNIANHGLDLLVQWLDKHDKHIPQMVI